MHFTEFWSIVERDHTIQNPTSPTKLRLLADYCNVHDGMSMLDIGCGKGWLLRDWSARRAITGTGLEINPWFVAEARERATAEGVADRLRFVEGPALEFQPNPGRYDIVTCIGASFALDGWDSAIRWMKRALKPDGVLAIGDVFLAEPPPAEALRKAWGDAPVATKDLHETVGSLESYGFELTGLIVAAGDDWDHYASRHWRAAHAWARSNPDHPHRAEVLAQIARGREAYLAFERRYLGWAIFVAQPRLA